MKKVVLLLAIIFMGINAYTQNTSRDSQWDFFSNIIPKQKSITISGNNWTMTINDKYRVSFSGTYNYSSETGRKDHWGGEWTDTRTNRANATFRGEGVVIWDNEMIRINLTTNASGDYTRSGRQRVNRGAGYIGATPKFVEEDFNNYASGSSTINTNFDLQAEYVNGQFSGKLRLSERTLVLNMSGSSSHTASVRVGSSGWLTANTEAKSQSELNASSKDEFGEWKWNTDRSKLFLKSQTSGNNFIIWNKNGEVFWSMEMEKNTKGASESTTETGDKLVNLSMSFDGTPAQVISFIENKEPAAHNNILLDYVVYNRFLGTLDKKSDGILTQIKDKQMLILTYSVNNSQKTDMYLLEGLDTIMDYLSK